MRHDELDRHAVDRDADRAALAALDDCDDLRQRVETVEERRGLRRRADDCEALVRVAPAARISRRLAAERRGDPADELPRPVQQQAAARARLVLGGERLEEPLLGLLPDSGHGSQPSGGRRLPELVGGADPERARDLDRTAGAEAEAPSKADEVRRDLALEHIAIRDPAWLDQLGEAPLDPG